MEAAVNHFFPSAGLKYEVDGNDQDPSIIRPDNIALCCGPSDNLSCEKLSKKYASAQVLEMNQLDLFAVCPDSRRCDPVRSRQEPPHPAKDLAEIRERLYMAFNVAMVLSCFVYFCCGCICGLIAFILARIGQSSIDNDGRKRYASQFDEAGARVMLRASFIVSIVGIITGTIAYIVVVVLMARFYHFAD